jgi:hypothetical protein
MIMAIVAAILRSAVEEILDGPPQAWTSHSILRHVTAAVLPVILASSLVQAIWEETRGAIVKDVIKEMEAGLPGQTAAARAEYQRCERLRDDCQEMARVAPSVETNRMFANASREYVEAGRRFNRLSARAPAMDVVARLALRSDIQRAAIASPPAPAQPTTMAAAHQLDSVERSTSPPVYLHPLTGSETSIGGRTEDGSDATATDPQLAGLSNSPLPPDGRTPGPAGLSSVQVPRGNGDNMVSASVVNSEPQQVLVSTKGDSVENEHRNLHG